MLPVLLSACVESLSPPSDAEPGETAGSPSDSAAQADSGETGDSGDTAEREVTFDECGWESLSEVAAAREVGRATLDGYAGNEGEITVYQDSAALETWWGGLGTFEDLGFVDFGSEHAAAVVTYYGVSSQEGETVVGVRQAGGTEGAVLGLLVRERCEIASDDRLPTAQVWAYPALPVSACRFGEHCE